MGSITLTDYALTQRKMEKELQSLLADTFVASTIAQNMHWNIVGPNFAAMHSMFEEQYKELAEAVDEIAERILMIGFIPASTLREFLELTSIEEPGANRVDTVTSVSIMKSTYDSLTIRAAQAMQYAEAIGDVVTVDLLTRRAYAHDKAAWMLRSCALGTRQQNQGE